MPLRIQTLVLNLRESGEMVDKPTNNKLKENTMKKINLEKSIVYGVALGWMASMLYLMLTLTATLTA